MYTHGKTLQQQERMPIPRSSTAATVNQHLAQSLTAGPGPHHCVYVCKQPLPLYRHLQLAPIAKHVHATSSSYHHCLPWSLAARPGGTAEDPHNPCSHCNPPQCSPRIYWCCGSQQPELTRNHDPTQTWSHHMPLNLCPSPPDPGSHHAPSCSNCKWKPFLTKVSP